MALTLVIFDQPIGIEISQTFFRSLEYHRVKQSCGDKNERRVQFSGDLGNHLASF